MHTTEKNEITATEKNEITARPGGSSGRGGWRLWASPRD